MMSKLGEEILYYGSVKKAIETILDNSKLSASFIIDSVFAEEARFLKLTQELLSYLDLDSINYVPHGMLDAISNPLNSMVEYLRAVAEDTMSLDAIIEKYGNSRQHYSQIYSSIHTLIGLDSARSLDKQRIRREIGTAVDELRKEAQVETVELKEQIKSHLADMQAMQGEISTILEDAKKAAGEIAITKQGQFFDMESKEHSTQSTNWLMGSIAILIVLIGSALFFLQPPKHSLTHPTTTQDVYLLIASRLIVFGALSYALAIAARNFMAHKHNAILNKHRYNALRTYRAILDGTTDDKVKDAILNHAATCIFSPQETGYTKHPGASQLPGVKSLVDVLVKPSEH